MQLITENENLIKDLSEAFKKSIEGLLDLDPDISAREFLSKKRAIEQLELFRDTIKCDFAGKKFLEIGCGIGTTLIVGMKGFNLETYGIEPSENEFSSFKRVSDELLKEHDLSSEIIYNSQAEKLPFEDDSFDLIYSTNVLEHVKDPKKVLSESIRVLKSGGYLQFVIPNYFSFWEGHYGIFWPCIINKTLAKIYVRFMGKNPAYVDTLQLINPIYLKKILKELDVKVEILGWGEEVFKNRLESGSYSDWASLKKIRVLVELIQKLKISSLMANVLNLFGMYTPIVLTLRKL